MNPGTDMSTNDKTSPNRPAGGKHIVNPIMNFYPAMPPESDKKCHRRLDVIAKIL